MLQKIVMYAYKKNKNSLKREPCNQIITYYPKQRFIMDLTELHDELNEKKKSLLNIIGHFSKLGISFLINNKESKTIFFTYSLRMLWNSR